MKLKLPRIIFVAMFAMAMAPQGLRAAALRIEEEMNAAKMAEEQSAREANLAETQAKEVQAQEAAHKESMAKATDATKIDIQARRKQQILDTQKLHQEQVQTMQREYAQALEVQKSADLQKANALKTPQPKEQAPAETPAKKTTAQKKADVEIAKEKARHETVMKKLEDARAKEITKANGDPAKETKINEKYNKLEDKENQKNTDNLSKAGGEKAGLLTKIGGVLGELMMGQMIYSMIKGWADTNYDQDLSNLVQEIQSGSSDQIATTLGNIIGRPISSPFAADSELTFLHKVKDDIAKSPISSIPGVGPSAFSGGSILDMTKSLIADPSQATSPKPLTSDIFKVILNQLYCALNDQGGEYTIDTTIPGWIDCSGIASLADRALATAKATQVVPLLITAIMTNHDAAKVASLLNSPGMSPDIIQNALYSDQMNPGAPGIPGSVVDQQSVFNIAKMLATFVDQPTPGLVDYLKAANTAAGDASDQFLQAEYAAIYHQIICYVTNPANNPTIKPDQLAQLNSALQQQGVTLPNCATVANEMKIAKKNMADYAALAGSGGSQGALASLANSMQGPSSSGVAAILANNFKGIDPSVVLAATYQGQDFGGGAPVYAGQPPMNVFQIAQALINSQMGPGGNPIMLAQYKVIANQINCALAPTKVTPGFNCSPAGIAAAFANATNPPAPKPKKRKR